MTTIVDTYIDLMPAVFVDIPFFVSFRYISKTSSLKSMLTNMAVW